MEPQFRYERPISSYTYQEQEFRFKLILNELFRKWILTKTCKGYFQKKIELYSNDLIIF